MMQLDVCATELFSLIEAHDQATASHCRRVRRYALWLADAVGLGREQRQRLAVAALLHDLGKVGVSPAVLNKPGSLTPAEYDQVKAHAALGALLAATLIHDRQILAAVRWHHERSDGRGYPDGLAGEEIPLLARILAIADSFDAMTATRSYRTGLSWDQAFGILQREASKQFDPVLVELFVERMEESAWNVPVVVVEERVLAIAS